MTTKYYATFELENNHLETMQTDTVTVHAGSWFEAVGQANAWRHGRLRDPHIDNVDLITISTIQ